VRLLLDTHVLLWSLAASRRLPAALRELVIDPRNSVSYSAASVWEIAIKSGLGRRDFRIDLSQVLHAAAATGFLELPVSAAHAARVTTLPAHHKDPFDRILVAQATHEAAILLTNDERLHPYGPVVRVFA
jgi:PIN domain nuclease of toxin-antitoxin system